jgi:hypothetical protein
MQRKTPIIAIPKAIREGRDRLFVPSEFRRRWRSFLLAGSLILILGLFLQHLDASIYGVPPGYTGAPYDGMTCATAGCHRGPVSTVQGWITTDIPATGYQPADTYQITLTATRASTSVFGFQLTAQHGDGTIGRFLVTDPVQTQYSQGDQYITHRETGTSGFGQKVWQCKWIAPDPPPPDGITLYASFVAGLFDIDDEVFLSARPLHIQQSVDPPGENALPPTVFPNPFYGALYITWPHRHAPLRSASLYNPAGERVYHTESPRESGHNLWHLNPGDLPNGTYLLEVRSDKHLHRQKVICRRR